MNEDIEFNEVAPWLVALITLAGGGLRVLLLDTKGMWLDETVSVWLANHSVGDVLRWTAQIDLQPPLYYLLLHLWTTVSGDSPYYARLLSVVFGALTIPVIYLIGKRMAGPMMGFAAAALFAVSPFNIRYAQETGMYTLLTFNAAVAMYALVRLLTDPAATSPIGGQFRAYLRTWRTAGPPPEWSAKKEFSYRPDPRDLPGMRGRIARSRLVAGHRWSPIRTVATDLAWVVFIVFSAATLLTHSAAVLFLLAANVFVLGLVLYGRIKKSGPPPAFQAPSLSNWAQAQAGIFLLWAPWLPTFVKQANAVYGEFWLPRPGWDTVSGMLRSFLDASVTVPGSAGSAALLWIPFALVAVLGLVAFRKKLSQFLFLASLIAVPILAELVVSLRRPVFCDRTLIWITVPLLLLLAAGIARLKFRPVIFTALMILASINLLSAGDYFKFTQRDSWSDAAGFVSLFAEEDDLVLFNTPRAQVAFDYYFGDFEENYGIRVEKHGVPVDLIDSGVAEPRMTESNVSSLASMLSGRKRAWLVYSHSAYTDPEGLIPRVFAASMNLVRQRDFYGGQVRLYEAP
jgi:mannosyltransferase